MTPEESRIDKEEAQKRAAEKEVQPKSKPKREVKE